MSFHPLRFEAYEASAAVPNVVVDGSPNAGTVLSLTHWPGYPAPEGLADDLSAQMAFRYLVHSELLHGDAQVVTNNHYDQDGLVSVFVLHEPELALAHQALLEGVAAAGDFATYKDRLAARISMLLWAFAQDDRSPFAPLPKAYPDLSALLYNEVLGLMPSILNEPDRYLEIYRGLWEEEDRHLSESELALANGRVRIDEHAEADLAVVTIDADLAGMWGHRFGARTFGGIHPMAVHNATNCLTTLVIHGERFRLNYRYESWVQYQSTKPRPRADLAELAERLTALETESIAWQATRVSDITPSLAPAEEAASSLAPDKLVAEVVDYLNDAPAAWDPYAASES